MWVAQGEALGATLAAAAARRRPDSPGWTASSVSDGLLVAPPYSHATWVQRTGSYRRVTTTTSTPSTHTRSHHDRLPAARDPPTHRSRSRAATATSSAATGSPPVKGAVLREHLPGQRQAVHRGRPRHRRGHRGRARRRACRRGPLGPYVGHRARQHPEPDRRPDRGEPPGPGRHRDLGQRQAGARVAGRRPAAGRRPLPLLRGRAPRPGGHASARSTRPPSPTTSTSRWASSRRSSRGTSRS